MLRKLTVLAFAATVLFTGCKESPEYIVFEDVSEEQRIAIYIDGSLFTNFYYDSSMDKQVLYPLYTASGIEITRGYPLNPRPYERVDHVHHYGLWFNFGDVNGIDFWNNSPIIPAERKHLYGTIRFKGILEKDPSQGKLVAASAWVTSDDRILITETTTYLFKGEGATRMIYRITELEAQTEVTFTEDKEGLIGIRVDRAFEEPAANPVTVTGQDGLPMAEKVLNNEGVNGQYRNASGHLGSEVWGKRSPWVALRGEKEGEVITIAILDHPENPGYPAWSHARGYGLFAANNLGGRAFDKETDELKITLQAGEKLRFNHKVIIGGEITDDQMNVWAKEF